MPAPLLPAGNAGWNTVAGHKAVIRAALAQLPGGHPRGNKVLVRVDGAGGTMSSWPADAARPAVLLQVR